MLAFNTVKTEYLPPIRCDKVRIRALDLYGNSIEVEYDNELTGLQNHLRAANALLAKLAKDKNEEPKEIIAYGALGHRQGIFGTN